MTKNICKILWCAILLAIGTAALAQTPQQMSFSGTLNDYSPGSVTPPGPWSVAGDWSVVVKGDSGKADFSASLTMVRSDLWVSAHGNVEDPSGRTPHTHHLTLTDGSVSILANGFRVSGSANITASGNVPPFGSPIPVTIDITGGNTLAFSNIKVTFGAPASGHFGTQPIEGVVNSAK